MLTQEQRDTFRRAVSSYIACGRADIGIDDVISSDDGVAETRDTIEDFFSANGRRLARDGSRPAVPRELNTTDYGDLYIWDDVQARKGARRGTVYVMDFGDCRAAYFDGEA